MGQTVVNNGQIPDAEQWKHKKTVVYLRGNTRSLLNCMFGLSLCACLIISIKHELQPPEGAVIISPPFILPD